MTKLPTHLPQTKDTTLCKHIQTLRIRYDSTHNLYYLDYRCRCGAHHRTPNGRHKYATFPRAQAAAERREQRSYTDQ